MSDSIDEAEEGVHTWELDVAQHDALKSLLFGLKNSQVRVSGLFSPQHVRGLLSLAEKVYPS